MGLDCSLVLYPGKPLSLKQVREVFATTTSGRLGRSTVLIRHAAAIVPASRSKAARRALNAIAAYERPPSRAKDGAPGPSLYFPQSMLEGIKDEAQKADRSLSWVVQQAWKLTRLELAKMPPPRPDEDEIGDDEWFKDIASELSKVTREALWVSCCDHSCAGGYARYEEGKELENVFIDSSSDGEEQAEQGGYEGVPDAAASRFAGGTEVSVQGVFGTLDDERCAPLRMIAEGGRFLSAPRRVNEAERPHLEVLL